MFAYGGDLVLTQRLSRLAREELRHYEQVQQLMRRLGVAPQALALYDLLSGVENLRFFGEMYGLSGAALRHRVAWSLEFVGLTERSRDRVSDYSGGMKRRLNLASALVHDPELVLLDEPTVGVDPQSRHQIFENILDLKRQGCTLIYTTHYMEEAARLCDRVAIVDKGRLLALGTVDELLSRYGARPTLVAQTNQGEHRVETDDPLAELNRLAAVGTVAAFQLERPTLEQVFLQLTGRSLRD
jgi:ABC-2 type transport system ATP-binding protein